MTSRWEPNAGGKDSMAQGSVVSSTNNAPMVSHYNKDGKKEGQVDPAKPKQAVTTSQESMDTLAIPTIEAKAAKTKQAKPKTKLNIKKK